MYKDYIYLKFCRHISVTEYSRTAAAAAGGLGREEKRLYRSL